MPFVAIKRVLSNTFDILHETDEEGTIREINEKIPVRGNNTWMLICSAILASIGLDTGSGAVIIGAMLISPLMSPILGVGLSVGINDREMLFDSIKNLSIAAITGLFFSFLYFTLTPLGEPTNELLARTTPTLLDVGVAFFGGVAGIISISRSDKSIAIPGVAIATALMPPLCTAGYGLAVGRMDFFLGAFYLFFINAVFISLATYLIVKYLKFHVKHYLDKAKEQKVARIMAVMVFIVVSPSIYFLYNVYVGVKTKKKIENLVVNDYAGRNQEIIKWEVAETDSLKVIKVYSVGNSTVDLTSHYNEVLLQNNLSDYRVKLVQLDISPEEVRQMASEVTSNLTKDFLKTIEIQKMQADRADSLQRRQGNRYTTTDATTDLKLLYRDINKVQIGEMLVASNQQARPDTIMLVLIDWEKQNSNGNGNKRQIAAARALETAIVKEREFQISRFLASKFRQDSVQVVSTF